MRATYTPTRTLAWMWSLLLVAGLAACGGSGGDTPGSMAGEPGADTPKSDFSLEDVNPNSATFSSVVTPRQQLTRVSAWYFGHAT